mmetsp:Transcript_17365/g.20847  ORF Transcript_17365/g.20847 Transcript_17365/m.20847 type:complete len:123 (-) Transcript_17365:345-713(-)
MSARRPTTQPIGKDKMIMAKGGNFLSQESIKNNHKVVYYCRICFSIIAGVVAGILGLTNLPGFLCYFVFMGLMSLGLLLKTGFSVKTYFFSWNTIGTDNIMAGAMTFVLFWVLFYDIVHIYD